MASAGSFALAAQQDPAKQDPAQSTVTRATLMRWHDALQQGGDTAGEARKKLVEHSAEAAPYLLQLLKRPGADRHSLLYLMGDLSEGAIGSLCQEAALPDSPVRAEIFKLLTKFTRSYGGPAPELVAVTMAALTSDDARVLQQVFAVLGGMRSVAELHLADASPIGPRCAVAMSDLPRAPLPALLAASLDQSAFVRCSAATAIAARSGQRVIEALCRLVADEDARVRTAAWQAVASQLACAPVDHAELVPLLEQRLARRIGGHVAETYDELRERAKLTAMLASVGKTVLPIMIAVLELPTSPEYWVAVETDKVREQAWQALLLMGEDAAEATSLVRAELAKDAMPMQLRSLALQVVRKLRLPAAEESRLCWQAYKCAQVAKPLEGLGKGYEGYFEAMRAKLVQVALAGLSSTDEAAVFEELAGAKAREAVAPMVVLATLVRIGFERSEVQQKAMLALRTLGKDANAGEQSLVLALSERVAPTTCSADIVRETLQTFVAYAGDRRRETYPHHHLHQPCIDAIAMMAQHLDQQTKSWLIESLIVRGNVAGTADETLSRLCVRIDAKLALQHRDQGIMGRRIVSSVAHAASDLLVADLDAEDLSVRIRAQQSIKSHGVANSATHDAFRQLLQKSTLRDPTEVMTALARLRPPADLLDLLQSWLPREGVAYEVLAALQPSPVPVIRELLATNTRDAEPTAESYRMVRHLLRGMRLLGADGAVHLPQLLDIARRAPAFAPGIGETLPYLGIDGVRALLEFGPTVRPPVGFALAGQMAEHVPARTRVAILGLLLSRGEAIEDVEQVAKLASRSRDARVRTAAQLLLANQAPDTEAATTTMLQALDGDSPALRCHAVKALAKKVGEARVRAYLYWLQYDDDERVRAIAKAAMR